MAVFTLNNLYSISDFNGLTNLQTGTFTLNAASTPDSISILDDDAVLEDTVNAPPQTLDGSQQVLNAAYDGFPAGTSVQSRATGEIEVTQPDGTIYTMEMNQILIDGNIHYSFQHDVPPGSTFTINSWQSSGNTAYTDLDAGDPIVEFEYNQVVNSAIANSVLGGGAIVNEGDLSSMFVNDQDSVLEDNNDSGSQTLDANIQNLSQAFGPHPAGSYVYARLYHEVTNTVTGETGRMYELHIVNDYNGQPNPASDGTFWAFSNDFNIGDGSQIIITPGTSPNVLGNVDHVDLFVCFASDTLIQTQNGEIRAEDLSQGDLVLTLDNGYQPVRWIGKRQLFASDLEKMPKLKPIRILAGALGNETPARDLLVSPQHRVMVASKIAERMFGETEVLVAAKHLVLLEGIDVADDVPEVTYVHFLFDRHEVVFSNGALTESLYTGPQALKSVSPESRKEILTIFPELADMDYAAPSARKLASGRMGRKLAVRHKNNRKALVETPLHH